MAFLPRGFKPDGWDSEAAETQRLREAYPNLDQRNFQDPSARAFFLEKMEKERPDPNSGRIQYRRYRNPDTGEIIHCPEGDSAAWLPKAEGYRGRFGEIKVIDGKPHMAKTLQPVTKYSGIND